ncbi:MAG: hypothetical protein ACPKPY_14240 [Nitrososphaeraceae archaeon]
MNNLKTVGNFATNYILNNEDIILDGKQDWNEMSKIILRDVQIHRTTNTRMGRLSSSREIFMKRVKKI